MSIKVKSANGKTGILIHVGNGQFRIRIYEKFATSYEDYDIKHSDLSFVIEDEDACLYTDGNQYWIDHGPETLGIPDTQE